jgi:hypothetical protein
MTPATDWKEVVPAGEAEQLERLGEQLREMQRRRANGKPAARALHAKGKAGVEAVFEVLPGVPDYARVGIFGSPSTYRAYVRFSNGAGSRQPDTRPDVRGIAVKLLGIPGKKIIPALADAKTQDFLLIQSTATPFKNADEFVWFVKANASPATLLPKMIFRFGPGRAIRMLKRLLASVSKPVASVATSRYYSALPTKFGPYAAKYVLLPLAAADASAKPGNSADYLGEELAARLAQGPVEYDLCAQFFVDENRTPIEDSSVEWAEKDAPFVKLARLTLSQQDMNSPRGRRIAEFVEALSFDPWHAPGDFQPLGNMMRARNAAYRLSTEERKAADEPDGTERFA